jgi:hypothetical protein
MTAVLPEKTRKAYLHRVGPTYLNILSRIASLPPSMPLYPISSCSKRKSDRALSSSSNMVQEHYRMPYRSVGVAEENSSRLGLCVYSIAELTAESQLVADPWLLYDEIKECGECCTRKET